MLYHCGLLSEQPERDYTLQLLRRGYWHEGLPPEIDRELRIWLSMPGFSQAFHAHTLKRSWGAVRRWVGRDYEQFKSEVAENWLSATRDDCVRLSRMRPGKGELPLLSKLQIMDDLKRGATPAELVRDYLTNTSIVNDLRNGRVSLRQQLPPGFSDLIQVSCP